MINTILDTIFSNTEHYKKRNSKEDRKSKAQFFTSKKTALQMADYLSCKNDETSIIEPGAGNGALAATVIFKLIKNGCKKITCTLIENDIGILPTLKETIREMESFATMKGVNLSFTVLQDNFLLCDDLPEYDIAIMNPPYKKIRKDSVESQKMSDFVYGQPNLYSLFMVKTLRLLKTNAEYVFIVPRSWTSGEYYKTVRKYILDNTDISTICIFNERNMSFSAENVLQETMIFAGKKNGHQREMISIDVSDGDQFTSINHYLVSSTTIKNIGSNSYLLIPSTQNEINVINKFSNAKGTFKDAGYVFKTGPVVEFRNKDFLHMEKEKNSIPMFRSTNISSGSFSFPIMINKPQYIDSRADKLLLANENTILVRRLSSKEEKRRIQCCQYKKLKGYSKISIENHVDYLTRIDGGTISESELAHISGLLMSDEYDLYFRLLNGNTQVNAQDLNNLPYLERGINQ